MRKAITLAMTLAVAMCFSQCKKNVEPLSTAAGDGVRISLSVDGGKHDVFPTTGAVVYGDGDVIYVGNNGKYVGSLTYADGTFSGTIYGPSTDDYLHFYFVGGLETGTLTAGSTTSFTVNISDQSSKLPVLSYGHSNVKYTDGNATYSCTLENKCGLVKFVPATATSSAVTVSGMKTEATIDFATPGITPTATTGTITLNPVSDDAKWAILLPQDAVASPEVSISGYTCSIADGVPAITENAYLNTGLGITMAIAGALEGEFSLSSTTKVYFSKSNVVRESSDGKFYLGESQYYYVGARDTYPSSYLDWSTACMASQTLYDSDGSTLCFTDWRIPTKTEWEYLIGRTVNGNTGDGGAYCRVTLTDSKDGKESVYGMIIFPDNYTGTVPSSGASITKTAFVNDYESVGCVFLPAAGYSTGSSVLSAGTLGHYWSCTEYDSFAYFLRFELSSVYLHGSLKTYGRSVRLVLVK
mgnify:CR=1 FL=1